MSYFPIFNQASPKRWASKSAVILGGVLASMTALANTNGRVVDQIKSKTGYGGIQAHTDGSGQKVISFVTTGVEVVLACAVLVGIVFVAMGFIKWRTLSNQNQPIGPAVTTVVLGIVMISVGAVAFGFSAELVSFFFKTS